MEIDIQFLNIILELEDTVQELNKEQQHKATINALQKKFVTYTYVNEKNECKLSGSFSGMDQCSIENVCFTKQTIMNKKISNCEFTNVTFTDMIFKSTQIINCKFKHCTFSNCTFKGNLVYMCELLDCQLYSNEITDELQFIDTVSSIKSNKIKNILSLDILKKAIINIDIMKFHDTIEFYSHLHSDYPSIEAIDHAKNNTILIKNNMLKIIDKMRDDDIKEEPQNVETHVEIIDNQETKDIQETKKTTENETTTKKVVEDKQPIQTDRKEDEDMNIIEDKSYSYYQLRDGRWLKVEGDRVIDKLDSLPDINENKITYVETSVQYPLNTIAGHIIQHAQLTEKNFTNGNIDGHLIVDSCVQLNKDGIKFTNTRFIRCHFDEVCKVTFSECTFDKCTFNNSVFYCNFKKSTFVNNIMNENIQFIDCDFDGDCSFDHGECYLEVMGRNTKFEPLNDIYKKKSSVKKYTNHIIAMIKSITEAVLTDLNLDNLEDEKIIIDNICTSASLNKKSKKEFDEKNLDEYLKNLSKEEKQKILLKLISME